MGAEEPPDVEMEITEYVEEAYPKFTYDLVLPKKDGWFWVRYEITISPDRTLVGVFDDKNKRVRIKLIENENSHFVSELKLFIINNSPFIKHTGLMAVAFGEVQIVIRQ